MKSKKKSVFENRLYFSKILWHYSAYIRDANLVKTEDLTQKHIMEGIIVFRYTEDTV
jgi:hypothetical protein